MKTTRTEMIECHKIQNAVTVIRIYERVTCIGSETSNHVLLIEMCNRERICPYLDHCPLHQRE